MSEMVTFYRPRGHHQPAVLWDGAKQQAVYEFIRGVYQTDDPEIIKFMIGLGFSTEPLTPQAQAVAEITADMTRPAAPPPPDIKDVPKSEPVLPKAAAPAPGLEAPAKKTTKAPKAPKA